LLELEVGVKCSWKRVARECDRGPTERAEQPDESGPEQADGLRRGIFHIVLALIDAIQAYLARHSNNPEPFQSTATAEQILAKVRRSRVTLDAITN
jgi:hypothetical protein